MRDGAGIATGIDAGTGAGAVRRRRARRSGRPWSLAVGAGLVAVAAGAATAGAAIADASSAGAGTAGAATGRASSPLASPAIVVPLLTDAAIFFSPDSAAHFASPGVEILDHGRLIAREVALPAPEGRWRVTVLVTIRPEPKDERSVHDRWDRAGNIRLRRAGGPDLELARFITAYGGRTEHELDATHLAPLLRGRVTIAAFIDTWVAPAWRIDCALRFDPDSLADPPSWAAPAFYTDSFNAREHGDGAEATVEIPAGLRRVILKLFTTGHCTDGRDADEFISKANVVSVDGRVVHRFHPWRSDCRRFRDRNPYTTRWSDGSWSSDYSRSGWCPGVEVDPVEIDLTDHLTPGRHALRFVVEGMRPEDEQGHHGYWRISAHLAGWDHDPALWRN